VDVRARQQPLKERYRAEPGSSRITLLAHGASGETPITCSVEVGRAIHEAQAHAGVGGDGTAACSGDLLLGALAACAQITLQMVAAATGIELARAEVTVEGDLDLAGTLGISRESRVGFEAIRLRFEVDAPGADAEQLAALREKTERYCVVAQTLLDPPPLQVEFA
jgi:uncharacterized OsmC-like protein